MATGFVKTAWAIHPSGGGSPPWATRKPAGVNHEDARQLATAPRNELWSTASVARSRPVPLDFETVEQEPVLPAGHSLTITGVERDARCLFRSSLPPCCACV